MDITDEMIQHFKTRTDYHIEAVQFYVDQLINRYGRVYGMQFVDKLATSAELHDASKYLADERVGYILMSWKYKDKSNEKDMDKEDKEIMDEAWEHHFQNNTHHPEYYKNVNDMPIDQLAHMCADWAAISEEVNDNLINWCNKVIPSEHKFNETNQKIIYEFCKYLYPIVTSRQVNRISNDKDGEFGEG